MVSIKSISVRRVAFGLWLALFPVFAGMLLWPINTRSLRLAILTAGAGLILGSLVFAWRRRAVFAGLLGSYVLLGLFMLLPGQPPDAAKLQADYVQAMKRYDGVRYVWGGETRLGIDCSGLVRKGLQNALFQQGLPSLNPRLIRAAVDLWWNDTTASEMGKGYSGRTVLVTSCSSLKAQDPASLRPGDLAVTTSGIHVMAYLGDNHWISADPGEGKVTIFRVPETENGWFSSPMTIVRWNLADG